MLMLKCSTWNLKASSGCLPRLVSGLAYSLKSLTSKRLDITDTAMECFGRLSREMTRKGWDKRAIHWSVVSVVADQELGEGGDLTFPRAGPLYP